MDTFSAFKEKSFEKELLALLNQNGTIPTWPEFKKQALETSGFYNVNWLKTEFDHTIAAANAAGKWQDFQENKDLYPNLKYDAVNDERTRASHRAWDGFVAPIDHPVWKKLYPPNDYGCRCTVIQTDEDVSQEIPNPKLKQPFSNNAALSGKIFKGSAYEKTLSKQEKKQARENLKKFKE